MMQPSYSVYKDENMPICRGRIASLGRSESSSLLSPSPLGTWRAFSLPIYIIYHTCYRKHATCYMLHLTRCTRKKKKNSPGLPLALESSWNQLKALQFGPRREKSLHRGFFFSDKYRNPSVIATNHLQIKWTRDRIILLVKKQGAQRPLSIYFSIDLHRPTVLLQCY